MDDPDVSGCDLFTAVEFPGNVKNTNRALEMLGGIEAIEVRDTQIHHPLELRYGAAQQSFYEKPARSQLSKKTLCVLELRRERLENGNWSEAVGSLLGMVEKSYEFRSLCDYQYQPPSSEALDDLAPTDFDDFVTYFDGYITKRNVDENLKKDKVVETEVESASSSCVSENVEGRARKKSVSNNETQPSSSASLADPQPKSPTYVDSHTFIVPQRFTRDVNVRPVLSLEADFQIPRSWMRKVDDKKTDGTGFVSTNSYRRKRIGHGAMVKHDQPDYPMEATPESVEYATALFSSYRLASDSGKLLLKEQYERILEMFEKRPMWTRNAILALVPGLQNVHLKRLMPAVAFYIQSGAWGRTWCKFGYDPRTTVDSVRYQTLQISLKNFAQAEKKSVSNVKREVLDKTMMAAKERDNMYIYRPGQAPAYRQMFYQLCDIELTLAESLIAKAISNIASDSKPDTVNSGWLAVSDVDGLRAAMTKGIKMISNVPLAVEFAV